MTKIYLSEDTETTGLPNFRAGDDDPSQPRMCQIALILFELVGIAPAIEAKELARYEGLVRPDGWEIGPDTTRVHGLTTELCRKLGEPIDQVLKLYAQCLSECDEVVGFNPAFDERILRIERHRTGLDRFPERPVLNLNPPCTELCRLAPTDAMMATGRKTWKSAKLREAVKVLLGRDHDRAHDAMADARANVDLVVYLANRGKLPGAKTREAKAPAPLPPGPLPDTSRITEF